MITQESIRSLLRREEFGRFLNDNGVDGIGLEVGTYRGEFAERWASQWTKALTIHTVDPWKHYDGYVDGCVLDWSKNKAPADLNVFREEAEKRLAPFKNVKIHQTSGLEFMAGVVDGTFSAIYLDGNHSKDEVWKEMQLGWRKLERGGILGGHDLYERKDSEQDCGVWPAVWNFAHAVGIRPHVTHCTSWWFVK